MNLSQPESAGIPLPPAEQAPGINHVGEVQAARPEAAPRPAATQPSATPDPTTVASLPLSANPRPAAPLSSVASATASLITDDDLIEKEWVNKAKQIVEQTRDDPYRQSENLTVFKADYLNKHYGKTIKISR